MLHQYRTACHFFLFVLAILHQYCIVCHFLYTIACHFFVYNHYCIVQLLCIQETTAKGGQESAMQPGTLAKGSDLQPQQHELSGEFVLSRSPELQICWIFRRYSDPDFQMIHFPSSGLGMLSCGCFASVGLQRCLVLFLWLRTRACFVCERESNRVQEDRRLGQKQAHEKRRWQYWTGRVWRS